MVHISLELKKINKIAWKYLAGQNLEFLKQNTRDTMQVKLVL